MSAVKMDIFFLIHDLISFLKVPNETNGTSAYKTKVFPLSGKYGKACFTACPVPSLSFCSQKIKSPEFSDNTYFFTSSFLYPVTRINLSGFNFIEVFKEC